MTTEPRLLSIEDAAECMALSEDTGTQYDEHHIGPVWAHRTRDAQRGAGEDRRAALKLAVVV